MPPGPVRISSEPLIRALHHRAAEIALVVYAGMVAYVSFVPFDITASPSDRSGPGYVFGLGITGASVADILANLAFYVPLGALGYIAFRRRKLSGVLSGCAAVALAALLSFAIEHGQHWLVSRVASWVDVITNVLGAGVGVILVGLGYGEGRRLLAGSRASARRNWWLAVSKVAVCGVLLIHLRPFDVAVDLFHTAAAVRHADMSPLAAWHGLNGKLEREIRQGRRERRNELARMRWEYALDRTADVAGYAGLSVLLAIGMAPQFRRRGIMFAWIGFIIVSLAAMITVIRIFLISHGFDTAHVFCGVAGWMIGCALPWSRIERQATQLWHRRPAGVATGETPMPQVLPVPQASLGAHVLLPRLQLPRNLQNTAMAVTLLLCVFYELVPFDFAPGVQSRTGLAELFGQVPFAAQLISRPNDAFYDISGKLLRYGAIGVCLAVMMFRVNRWPWRGQLIATTFVTTTLCLAFQLAHLFMPTRHADITTLVLAMTGAFAGSVAVRWARDYRASISVLVRDDLLTAQLIEGETYDKCRLSMAVLDCSETEEPRASARAAPSTRERS